MLRRRGGWRAYLTATGVGVAIGIAGPAAVTAQPDEPRAGVEAPATLDASLDTVTLVTGETLTGRVVAQDNETITLDHPVLGEIVLTRSGVASIALAPAPIAPAGKPEPAPVDQIAATADLSIAQPAADPIEPAEPPAVWSGRFELGANGASGNSDTTSIYAALGVKREAPLSTFTDDLSYRLATDDGATTTNRFFNRARYERRLAEDGRWSWFAQTSQEVDEFKDYDLRLSGSGGVGYDAIQTERTTLSLYAGAGAAREFGGTDDNLNPFALVGAAYSHRLNGRVSLSAGGEFEPRLDDAGEFRLRGKAALDVDLNESGSLKLSLGVEDEFDSDPGAAQKNDVYYYASIVYAF